MTDDDDDTTEFWIRQFESLPSLVQHAVNKHILKDHPECVFKRDLQRMHEQIHERGKTIKEAKETIDIVVKKNWEHSPADRCLTYNSDVQFHVTYWKIVYRRFKNNDN